MKKITASKTLSITLKSNGKVYLPDDLTLRDKNIISIIPVLDMYSFADNAVSTPVRNASNLFINLTSDGQKYFWENLPIQQIASDTVRGKFVEINRKLSLPDCYITCTGADTDKQLILVILYENAAYRNSSTNVNSNYDYSEIPLLYQNGYRNPLPENNTLRGKKFRNIIVSFPEVTPNSYQGVEQSEIFEYTYLTLCKGSQKIIEQMPISLLLQLEEFELMKFDNIEFDMENSYIQIYGDNHAITDTNLYLVFEYEK